MNGMKKKELAHLLVLAIFAFGLLARLLSQFRTSVAPSKSLLRISPQQALGLNASNWHSQSDAYTLIYFLDFCCPPCRQSFRLAQEKLRINPKLRAIYRNLPLSKIHPNAYQAAIVAEVARQQGQYPTMQNLLFEDRKSVV